MRVVADSHTLLFLLTNPAKLSEPAVEALAAAEQTEGIVVSALSLGDIWYATQKTSSAAVPRQSYELMRAAVANPALNLQLAPVTAATMAQFDRVPLAALRDPEEAAEPVQPPEHQGVARPGVGEGFLQPWSVAPAFDRVILATALDLGIPLVTADRAISATQAVEVIW